MTDETELEGKAPQEGEDEEDTPDSWRDRAEQYLEDRRYVDAIHAYERVIELEPDNPQNYRDLAHAYVKFNDLMSAAELYERAYLLERDGHTQDRDVSEDGDRTTG